MMQQSYQTQRLLLRRSSVELAEQVLAYEMRNKQFLQPFEPTREPDFYTLEGQRRLLDVGARSHDAHRYWMSLLDEPDTVIGMVGASSIIMGPFKSCFLSYKSDVGHLRKGHVAEAVAALCKALFTDGGLHRIEANIMPRNSASLAVCRKAGFVNEGTASKYLKINGVWEDHVHMVLLNTICEV